MAEIQENQQNPIFGRKEVILEVNRTEYEPSYSNAVKLLSEKFSADLNKFKINKVETTFGKESYKIYANVYDSYEEKERLEKKSKKEQEAEQKLEEERKAQEAPAEENSEEPETSGESEENTQESSENSEENKQ